MVSYTQENISSQKIVSFISTRNGTWTPDKKILLQNILEKNKVFSDHTYFYILDKNEGNLNSSQTAVQPPPWFQL